MKRGRVFAFLIAAAFLVLHVVRTQGQAAPGAPGSIPTWTSGGKEAVGTATSTESKVWFTLESGIMTEVYYPQHDTVLIDLEFSAPAKYSLYLLYDPALNNSGYGDTGYSQDGALVAQKSDVACALLSSGGFERASSGFAGVGVVVAADGSAGVGGGGCASTVCLRIASGCGVGVSCVSVG